MKRTSSSLLQRSVRFGACAGAVTFALAITGGVGAFALGNREVPEDSHVATSADTANPGAGESDRVSPPPASDLPIELAQAFPQLTPPEPDRPPAVVVTPAATPVPVLAPAPRVSVPPAPAEGATAVAGAQTLAEAEPPVQASRETLYGTIAATFPEQPDKAYRVVMCESGGYAATNTGNGYYGLWQFDLPTWQSVGGTGLPSDASAAEQVMRARMLYDARGWSPWGCA